MAPSDQKEFDHYVAVVRAQLEDRAFVQVWSEGRTMTIDQAIAYALENQVS